MLVFIFGCARSGTSVLGELIARHPQVEYLGEENQAIWHGLYNRDHHRLTAADATDDIKDGLRAIYRHTGKVLVEKMPPHSLRIPFIRAVFPEARLIYIYRDGRDVACSLMPGIGGDSWNHLRPRGWRGMFELFTGLERCARLWQAVTEQVEADLIEVSSNGQGVGIDHLRIKYEDLVNDAPNIASKICKYLGSDGIPPAMLRYAYDKISDDNGGYTAQPGIAWHRGDHKRRVGRWVETATIAEWESLNRMLKPTLRMLGYEVYENNPTPVQS